MIEINGYQIDEQIFRGAHTTVYRATKEESGEDVIIKTLTADFPSAEDMDELRHDYEIGSQFAHPNIIKYDSLEPYQNNIAIVSKYFTSLRLSDVIPQKGLEVVEFINIATQLTEGLATIHDKNIIVMDIKPQNIGFNQDSATVKYFDFGISTYLEQESQQGISIHKLSGTLHYMSPEQTGRMNRAIDYRTDFYSLGMTFYELICGSNPCNGLNLSECVYFHIAKIPPSPLKVRPDIPPMLSNIIMKLVEKNAEDRYQNANGLLHDLKKLLGLVESNQTDSVFKLGRFDFSNKFRIPEHLYGRESEINVLEETLDKTAQGISQTLVVSGSPGIGKSSLIYEIQKAITHRKGKFIAGKFDEFTKENAYAAIIKAFTLLIKNILSEQEEQIYAIKEKLLSVLSSNAQIIVEMIPSLELIIGKQAPVQELGPLETQNRFNRVFADFVEIFAYADSPLTLFIDDLHWADTASLNLLEKLINNPNINYFLLITSYRDNELDETHPAYLMLDRLKSNNNPYNHIRLSPLNLTSTNQLIADVLKTKFNRTQELANIIHSKTEGNPFFLKLFIQTLYDQNLLRFDLERGWYWDAKQVSSLQATENVAQLMLNKLSRLPDNALEMLKIAACLGHNFQLTELQLVADKSPEEVSIELFPALREGILLRRKKTYYFVHDRVQEAAYSLIEEHETKQLNLNIGRTLLANLNVSQRDQRIFSITNHLNKGISLINSDEEKTKLAELNLEAANKAVKNTAYNHALRCFKTGLRCLGNNAWKHQYQLCFQLQKGRAECEYLTGNFDTSLKLLQEALKNTNSIHDTVQIYCMLVYQYTINANYAEGINSGRKALLLLDVTLSEQNLIQALEKEIQLAKENLAGRDVASLFKAPLMQDPQQKLAMQVLMSMQPTAYMFNPDLYSLIAVKMANISLQHGHIPESAKAYITYANILSSVFHEYRLGYEFGKLGLKMSDSYNDLIQKCRGRFIYVAFLVHWQKHLNLSETVMTEGYQFGLNCGDFQYAAYNLSFGTANLFYQGYTLPILEKKLDGFMRFALKAQHQMSIDTIQSFQLAIENLRDRTTNRLSFDTNHINEMEFLKRCFERNTSSACYLVILKAQILYLAGEYEQALERILLAKRILNYIRGTIASAEFNFYYSLILCALYPKELDKQSDYLSQILENQQQMKMWMENCEDNFEHKYLLVEAQLAEIDNRVIDAMSLFDQARDSAIKFRFIQAEALINEQCARFWFSLKREKVANEYLDSAYHAYMIWGASSKLRQLEGKFSRLKEHVTIDDKGETTTHYRGKRTSQSHSNVTESIDIRSVMEASQTISEEIIPERLMNKVMCIMIENAGAQRGYFLFNQGEKLEIMVGAEINEEQQVSYIPAKNLSNKTTYSRSIVNYVQHSQESVVLDDAANEERFEQDDYIREHQTKSLLCQPILHQGELKGILYLENNLVVGAFTANRLELLNLLSSQAAISLVNANHYAELEEKVAERTKELKQKNQALQETHRQLEELSLTDTLTAMRNRRFLSKYLDDDLVVVLRKHQQHIENGSHEALQNADLIFFLLDIDHFKQVNDTYGHSAGDQVLIKIRNIIKKIFRESDYIVRWGGEEIVVIARFVDRKFAPVLAERLRKAFENYHFEIGENLSIRKTCSIGFASYPFLPLPNEDVSWLNVIDIADAALYAVKHSGRNAWLGLEPNLKISVEQFFQQLNYNPQQLIDSGNIELFSPFDDDHHFHWKESDF